MAGTCTLCVGSQYRSHDNKVKSNREARKSPYEVRLDFLFISPRTSNRRLPGTQDAPNLHLSWLGCIDHYNSDLLSAGNDTMKIPARRKQSYIVKAMAEQLLVSTDVGDLIRDFEAAVASSHNTHLM